MKLKLSMSNLYIALYTVIMMLGNFTSHSLLSLAHHGIAAVALFVLLAKRYRPTKFMLLVSGYILFILADTFFVNDFYLNFYTALAQIKILLYAATVDMYLQKNQKETVNGYFKLFAFLVFVNTALMLAVPEGLIQTEVVVNEWTTVKRAVWPLGNSNSMIGYYIMLLVLLVWDNRIRRKKPIVNFTVIAVTVLGIVLAQSTTSLIVVLLSVMITLYGLSEKKETSLRISLRWLYVLYAVILVLLILGEFSILNPVLEALFSKDATFTSRSEIWARVLELVKEKPLFGWGYLRPAEIVEVLGRFDFTSAHNQVLNTLWQTGFVGLSLLIAIFVYMSRRVRKIRDNRIKNTVSIFIFALQIEVLFETALTRFEVWTYLLVCAALAEFTISCEQAEEARLSEVTADENMQ